MTAARVADLYDSGYLVQGQRQCPDRDDMGVRRTGVLSFGGGKRQGQRPAGG
jgi:hypothetical protein